MDVRSAVSGSGQPTNLPTRSKPNDKDVPSNDSIKNYGSIQKVNAVPARKAPDSTTRPDPPRDPSKTKKSSTAIAGVGHKKNDSNSSTDSAKASVRSDKAEASDVQSWSDSEHGGPQQAWGNMSETIKGTGGAFQVRARN